MRREKFVILYFGVMAFSLLLTGCKDQAQIAARAKQQRERYIKDEFVGEYEKVGSRDLIWDEPAKAALNAVAQIRIARGQGVDLTKELGAASARRALKLGCDDALVRYCAACLEFPDPLGGDKERAQEWVSIADALWGSSYSQLRRFYGSLKASQALHYGPRVTQEVHNYRVQALESLCLALTDSSVLKEEGALAARVLLSSVKKSDNTRNEFYGRLEPLLFPDFKQTANAWLAKGEHFIEYAWDIRGGGFADTVSKDQWEYFKKRMEVAEEALEKSWQIFPAVDTAIGLMRVELAQGRGRARLEDYFQKAMQLDPNSYDACWNKLFYLFPRWHGSEEDLLQFGRECLVSTNWGGKTPMILVDAHQEISDHCEKYNKLPKGEYWKNPEVWREVKAAFEKFFRLNPKAYGHRHNYALYAYRCGDLAELRKQLPLLGPVNFKYFGGETEFNRMKEAAASATE